MENLNMSDFATRDTTIKYAGAASVKLVAVTDSFYFQTITLPDTSIYTFTAYAYKGAGQAVTTNDLNLYYDTGVISTVFTSVGSDWYSLTGTVTGVTSAKNFGVGVKAGITVYVDSFSLQSGSGVTTTFSMLNSGTGNLHYSVEGTSTLNAGVATEQGLIVKGAATQSANLTEIQNSTGTILSHVNSDGTLDVGVATGTAPLVIASTTVVTNLNSDAVDGKHVGTTGNTIPLLDGNNTFSGTTTHTGAMIVRSVTDAGPMTATNGTVGGIVYNTSDSGFYGCTVTGSPATWVKLG